MSNEPSRLLAWTAAIHRCYTDSVANQKGRSKTLALDVNIYPSKAVSVEESDLSGTG